MSTTLPIRLVLLGVFASSLLAAQETWTLKPDLRIGGEQDGARSFADVRGVVATTNGNIAVLEYQAQEVRLFDARGKFIKLLARKGSGPAEIRDGTGLAVGADDVIWAHDPANRRYARFFPDMRAPEFTPFQIRSVSFVWGAVVDTAGRLFEPNVMVRSGRINPESGAPLQEYRVRFVSADGKVKEFGAPTCGERERLPSEYRVRITSPNGTLRNFPIPFLETKQVSLTSTGHVWCTPADEYALYYGRPDSLKEVFRKKITRVPVTDGERRIELARFDSLKRAFGPITSGNPELMPKVKPAVEQLFADDAGRAWVRLTGSPEDAPEFDVVGPGGRLVAKARVSGKVGTFVYVRGNALYTVVRDDDDVPFVVRYIISRR